MGFLSKIFGGSAKKPEAPAEQKPAPVLVTEDVDVFTETLGHSGGFFDFYIAGLAHHCNMSDLGFFIATIFNEKDNPYDRKAMAVGDQNEKKIVGYVPAANLENYRKWCKRQNCIGVGYIYYDRTNLRGRVRAYQKGLDMDLVLKDMQEYANIVCEHFGWAVPNITT